MRLVESVFGAFLVIKIGVNLSVEIYNYRWISVMILFGFIIFYFSKRDVVSETQSTVDIVDLYLNNYRDLLYNAFDYLRDTNAPMPLDDLFFILEDSLDSDIQTRVLEVLVFRLKDIRSILLNEYETTDSAKRRFNVLSVFCSKPDVENYDFIVTQYLKHKNYRSYIEDQVFVSDETTFLCLALFIESHKLSVVEEKIITELMMKLDPNAYFNNSRDLRYMKISELFYSIDPDKFLKKN